MALAMLFVWAAPAPHNAPLRRSHYGIGCSGLGTCNPKESAGGRTLAIQAPGWTASTDFQDGASSFDTNFQRNGGPGRSEAVRAGNAAITWAGDATSSLVMLRDDTDESRSLYQYAIPGITAGSVPGPSNNPNFLYTEIDWPTLVAKLGIRADVESATFRPDVFANADSGGISWPTSVDSNVSPFFRLYDHGTCSVHIPWLTDQNSIYPSVQQIVAGGGLPKVGTEYRVSVAGYLLNIDAKVSAFDFGFYPHLGTGAQVPDDPIMGIHYPFTDYQNDEVILAGRIGVHVDISCGFDETNRCDFDYHVLRRLGLRIDDTHPFGARVVIDDHGQALDKTEGDQGCQGTAGFGLGCYVPPFLFSGIVRGQVENQLTQALNKTIYTQLPATFGSALSLALPTQFELLHWVSDTCQPDLKTACYIPSQPDPAATNVGTASCARRIFSENPTVDQTGFDDFRLWQSRVFSGGAVPRSVLTTYGLTGGGTAPKLDQQCATSDARGLFPDQHYAGCLTPNLTVDASVCSQLAKDYNGLADLLRNQGFSSAADAVSQLSAADLECRPLTPGGVNLNGFAGLTNLQATAFCSNDLPSDSICSIRPVWNVSNKDDGFPPDTLTCQLNATRHMPAPYAADKCSTLADACIAPDGSLRNAQCLDYYLFCTNHGTYCGQAAQQVCDRQPSDVRCIERSEYCDNPIASICLTSDPVARYCNQHPSGSAPECTPSGYEPPIPLRQTCDVQQGICTFYDRVCGPAGCGRPPIDGPLDHWCSLHIPASRVNISPAGAEVVLTDGLVEPERWHRILFDLQSTLAGAPFGLNLAMCLNPSNHDSSNRPFNRAGWTPRVVLGGSPP